MRLGQRQRDAGPIDGVLGRKVAAVGDDDRNAAGVERLGEQGAPRLFELRRIFFIIFFSDGRDHELTSKRFRVFYDGVLRTDVVGQQV